MRALVTYFSQTGNTRKVAEEIYQAITCEKEHKDCNNSTVIINAIDFQTKHRNQVDINLPKIFTLNEIMNY